MNDVENKIQKCTKNIRLFWQYCIQPTGFVPFLKVNSKAKPIVLSFFSKFGFQLGWYLNDKFKIIHLLDLNI